MRFTIETPIYFVAKINDNIGISKYYLEKFIFHEISIDDIKKNMAFQRHFLKGPTNTIKKGKRFPK